ncbi:hypothetical protein PTKIN_Ptkin09bG0214300 [Pterospermum kingtungense]
MAFTKMLKDTESRRLWEVGLWRLLLLLALLITIANGLNFEGQLLLELKNGFHDEYNYLGNWNSTDERPCGWIGINCSSDYEPVVWSVNLSSMNLSGTLSPSIGGLTHLTFLDLSYNGFSGNIPKEIGNCSRLAFLYLNNNHLSGLIPGELGKLSYLRSLNICNNKISGSLPEELGKLSSLEEFVAFTNNLTGPLPNSIGNLQKLRIFRAGQNAISGNIPAEISGCQSLQMLGLAQNRIGGELPKEIGMLRSMTDLILWENQLSGFIPKELGNCTSLQTLALYANGLVGQIPMEIGNLKFLKKLYLYRNQLNGSIPGEIGNLSLATEIDFSENFLTGEFPIEFSKIKGLVLLYLFQNQLTGVIPNELCSLRNLTRLDLSINYLTGPIPYCFQYLTEMVQLQLFDNSLSGSVPQQLGVYSPLWVVDFSNNQLTGKIPPYLCRHSNLILLNLGANKLFLENKGLCGRPLQSCIGDPSSPSMLPVNKSTRGRIIIAVAGVVGGVSIIFIVILIYQMRRPPEIVESLPEKEIPSPAPDIYFHPKEGFTFQDLIEATNNFHESYILGRGACGTVYRAVMHSGQTIAVKRLASNAEGNNIENSFRAEIQTLGKIRHRNIVKLYGFCYHQGSNLLLYEYMEKGSLGEVLHGSSCILEWSTRFMIALGAAEGLAYLHHDCKPRIIHRDIKSNNILLDENFEAHVGDFGLAKVIDMPQSKSVSAVAGSYGYIAPEYAYTMKVTEKCDTYSYGVVLLELLTGKTPVQPLEQGGDLVTRVRHYVREHSLTAGILDDRLNLDDKSIVDHMITVLKIALICTSMSPFDRPSMREVVLMLIESKRKEDNLNKSPTCELPLRHNCDESM